MFDNIIYEFRILSTFELNLIAKDFDINSSNLRRNGQESCIFPSQFYQTAPLDQNCLHRKENSRHSFHK